MRLAAIDIGSNSIHMVIAEATHGDAFTVLDREREVVQVGRGSFKDRRLRPDAMNRTALALARFVQLARRHGVDRILCTATAAVREARNGGDFLKLARRESGVAPRVIPSDIEGRLVHLAIHAALHLPDRPALLVDIGGGSVQLVRANGGELQHVTAAPVGALRLTETLLEHDPPTFEERTLLRRVVRKQLRRALGAYEGDRPQAVYGSSGTIHALAELAYRDEHGRDLPQLNGHVLGLDALSRLARRLERMTLAERQRLPGIDEARAEIIVPGAVVLEQLLRLTDTASITLSDYGVREGLVTDWLRRHARELSAIDSASDLRLRSVLGLLGRFDPDGSHARHVAQLSLQLFDELSAQHGYGAREREWLHFAALLHDVGAAVAYDGHAQHSAYVIRNGGLRGLAGDEVEMVAIVARHHGGGRPRKRRDEAYAALPRRLRRTARWLSAMLRVAEGLDRSHYQLVRWLRVRRRRGNFVIVAGARSHAQLEGWAGRSRAKDLGRLLGQPIEVRRADGAAPSAARDATRDAGRASAALPPAPQRSAAHGRSADAATGAPSRPAGNGQGSRPQGLPSRSASG